MELRLLIHPKGSTRIPVLRRDPRSKPPCNRSSLWLISAVFGEPKQGCPLGIPSTSHSIKGCTLKKQWSNRVVGFVLLDTISKIPPPNFGMNVHLGLPQYSEATHIKMGGFHHPNKANRGKPIEPTPRSHLVCRLVCLQAKRGFPKKETSHPFRKQRIDGNWAPLL